LLNIDSDVNELDDTKRLRFQRWEWLLAPLLVAIYPVLFLYAKSVEEASPSDVLICGAVTVLISVGLAYLFGCIFASRLRGSLAAAAVIAWSFLFSGYLRVGRLIAQMISSSHLFDYLLLGIWLITLAGFVYLIFRLRWSEERFQSAYRFVSLTCMFAVGFAAYQCMSYVSKSRTKAATIWESNDGAIPTGWKAALPSDARDIYFIIFDRYANDEVLRKFFGFDNSEFYRELEKRGFKVDRRAKSEYPMTAPAMASVLNMRYLGSQFGQVTDYFPAMQTNEVSKLLVDAGYKYHYFGNYYAPLRKSDYAEWNLKISTLPCEFADSLVNMTLLRPLIGRNYKHHFVTDKFTQLGDLAGDPKTTFAYAHFLVPHPPYAFARDGSQLTEWARSTQDEKTLYIDQLIATNRLILKTLDQILAKSDKKPIVFLQADEGPYLMPGDETLSRDEKIEKRSGILSAALIPDEYMRDRMPDPLTPVNTFRFVFREYFGAPIDLLPSRMHYWERPTKDGVASPGSQILEITSRSAVGQ
jgi:hypothetical protein